jgi:hypothetical protein
MSGSDLPTAEVAATSELTVAISQTVAVLFSTGNLEETLSEVMDMAVSDIEGCDFAALLLMDGDGVVTVPARTDRAVDGLGLDRTPANGGALLDALASQVPFYAADLADGSGTDRAVGVEAVEARCLLMLPLTANAKRGGLALFARYPHAFGAVDRARGLVMAYLAGVALAAIDAADHDDRLAANLQSSLAIREVISQAQGILMEREHIGADQAFTLLRRASTGLEVKMREVAQALIDSGEWPDPRVRESRGHRYPEPE